MALITREMIETFISITGAHESVALQTLQAYAGNLNEAVDAYFRQGDRNFMQEAPVTITAPSNVLMDIDYPPHLEPRGPSSLLSAPIRTNPLSLFDPTFRRSYERPNIFDYTSGFTGLGGAPFVTQPREVIDPTFRRLYERPNIFEHASELRGLLRTPLVTRSRQVRQVPVEFRGGHANSVNQPSHGPRMENVTDIVDAVGTETRGTVNIDNDNPRNLRGNSGVARPVVVDDSEDFGDDIEEEMIRAAIEASKRDAELQNNEGLDCGLPQQGASQHDDTDFGRAVSLSARMAERQNLQRGHGLMTRVSGSSSDRLVNEDEVLIVGESNRRQGVGFSGFPSSQRRREAGSSSIQAEVDWGAQPLVRRRPRYIPLGSVEARRGIEGTEVSPLWGGMSSEEHDEAVMLEAAMFGRVPESGYRIPYAPHQMMRAPHQMMRPRVDADWRYPRPPSPNLLAQRAIREQQNDEYLASLQADRERELKAMAEEIAAREAALEEQRRKDEAAQRKLAEEQELAAKQASLPEEPTVDDENTITILVRMPDGSRHGRRFRKSDKLQSLFDFIDVGRTLKPGTYRLVRPYPRKAFSNGESSLSFSELGLTSKQEALFLELI